MIKDHGQSIDRQYRKDRWMRQQSTTININPTSHWTGMCIGVMKHQFMTLTN